MLAHIPTIKEDGFLVRRANELMSFFTPNRDGLREYPAPPREQPSPQRPSREGTEKNKWQGTSMTLNS